MSTRSRHHSGLIVAWGLPALVALVLAFVLFTPIR